MEDVWFEEELVPLEATVKEIVKSVRPNASDAAQQIRSLARGTLRVDKPRWGELDPVSHKLLTSGKEVRFYLVRLGFQFDIPQKAREQSARFVYARCLAHIWPVRSGQPQPTVYEVIPRELYEGEPRTISVKIGPELRLGEVGGSLGEVSGDLTIGTIEPVIVGWTGESERAPYWDLRPKSKTLLGVRHLWLVIEVPLGCSGVRLAVRAEGDVQTHFGPIPIGPRSREWDSRPSVVIGSEMGSEIPFATDHG